MAGHIGFQRHWRLRAETTWGGPPSGTTTTTGASDWFSAPAIGSGYRIKQKQPPYVPEINAGAYQRHKHVMQFEELAGAINTLLYRDSCEFLLNLCTERTSNVLGSFEGQIKDPVETKLHKGLMVDSWSLSGDEGGEVLLNMDCIGKGPEETTTAFDDPTYVDEAPFIFQHGAFYLSNSAGEASDLLAKIYSFELSGKNNLQKGPINSDYVISDLVAGQEEIEGKCTIVYEAATWNAALRAGTAIGFKVVLTHPDGGTDGVITIRCDDCWIHEAPEEGDVNGLCKQTINFSAEMPDSGNQISIVVSNGS